jgi:hypothetical protein
MKEWFKRLQGLGGINPISMKTKLIGGGLLALLVAGLLAFAFLRVYNAGVSQANHKVTQYEQKIDKLNTELAKKEVIVRERIFNHYYTKQIVRTKVEYKNRDVIRTVVPEQFKLSEGWIHAHDQSAKGEEIDPILAANSAPSEVSDRSALIAVTDNYNIANRNADQMEALQKYIRDMGFTITNDPKATNRPN